MAISVPFTSVRSGYGSSYTFDTISPSLNSLLVISVHSNATIPVINDRSLGLTWNLVDSVDVSGESLYVFAANVTSAGLSDTISVSFGEGTRAAALIEYSSSTGGLEAINTATRSTYGGGGVGTSYPFTMNPFQKPFNYIHAIASERATLQDGTTIVVAARATIGYFPQESTPYNIVRDVAFQHVGGIAVEINELSDTPSNQLPVAEATIDKPTTLGGHTVTLDASGSNDPDGSIASILWEQTSGTPVTLSNTNQATTSFVAPNIDEDYTFQLTITDDFGDSATDSVSFTSVANAITGRTLVLNSSIESSVLLPEYTLPTTNEFFTEVAFIVTEHDQGQLHSHQIFTLKNESVSLDFRVDPLDNTGRLYVSTIVDGVQIIGGICQLGLQNIVRVSLNKSAGTATLLVNGLEVGTVNVLGLSDFDGLVLSEGFDNSLGSSDGLTFSNIEVSYFNLNGERNFSAPDSNNTTRLLSDSLGGESATVQSNSVNDYIWSDTLPSLPILDVSPTNITIQQGESLPTITVQGYDTNGRVIQEEEVTQTGLVDTNVPNTYTLDFNYTNADGLQAATVSVNVVVESNGSNTGYYLNHADEVDDHVQIAANSTERMSGSADWELVFRASNHRDIESVVIGCANDFTSFVVLRSSNQIDLRLDNNVSYFMDVTDVTDPNAVYKLRKRTDNTVEWFENDVSQGTISIASGAALENIQYIGRVHTVFRGGRFDFLDFTNFTDSSFNRSYDASNSNGTGTVLTDTSGNGRDGTLIGFNPATAWVPYGDTGNTAPLANAGEDVQAGLGQTITLNFSGSLDPDGDDLTYSSVLRVRPSGSTDELVNPNTVNPTITINNLGIYEIDLVVNDGTADSVVDTVVITGVEFSNIESVIDAINANFASNPVKSGGAISVDLNSVTALGGVRDIHVKQLAPTYRVPYNEAKGSVNDAQRLNGRIFNTVAPTIYANESMNWRVEVRDNDTSTVTSATLTVPVLAVQGTIIADAGSSQSNLSAGDNFTVSSTNSSASEGIKAVYWEQISGRYIKNLTNTNNTAGIRNDPSMNLVYPDTDDIMFADDISPDFLDGVPNGQDKIPLSIQQFFDLECEGWFRFGGGGESSAADPSGALAVSEDGNSLYMAGRVTECAVAKVQIPTTVNKELEFANMVTATVENNFVRILRNSDGTHRVTNNVPTTGFTQDNVDRIYGLAEYNGWLLVSCGVDYDAGHDNERNIVKCDISQPRFAPQGIYKMSGDAAIATGAITKVPDDVATEIGYSHIVGGGTLDSISSRWSKGITVVGFDPQDIVDTTFVDGTADTISDTQVFQEFKTVPLISAPNLSIPKEVVNPMYTTQTIACFGMFVPNTDFHLSFGRLGGLHGGVSYKGRITDFGTVQGGGHPANPNDSFSYFWLHRKSTMLSATAPNYPHPEAYGKIKWALNGSFLNAAWCPVNEKLYVCIKDAGGPTSPFSTIPAILVYSLKARDENSPTLNLPTDSLTFRANIESNEGVIESDEVVISQIANPVDTVKPVINLSPSQLVYNLNVGDAFTPPVATLTDNVDGNRVVQPTSNNVNMNVATNGTPYQVVYSGYTDQAGNVADTVTVLVNVTELPNTLPVLTLTATPDPASAGQNVTFTANVVDPDVGATFSYLWDTGETTSSIVVQAPTSDSPSTLTRSCQVTDNRGGQSDLVSITVDVNAVQDTTIPTLNVSGSPRTIIQVGQAVPSFVASATDDRDGDITNRIVITGSVDNQTIGLYTLRYNVTDLSGNSANEVVREVEVVANQGSISPPLASITSPAIMRVGGTITLVGNFTDDVDENGPYRYQWRIITGSDKATLLDSDEITTAITATRVGTIQVGFTVFDQNSESSEVVQTITVLPTIQHTSNARTVIRGIPNGSYIANFTHLASGDPIQRKIVTFSNEVSNTTLPVPIGTSFDVAIKNQPLTNYTGKEGVTT